MGFDFIVYSYWLSVGCFEPNQLLGIMSGLLCLGCFVVEKKQTNELCPLTHFM